MSVDNIASNSLFISQKAVDQSSSAALRPNGASIIHTEIVNSHNGNVVKQFRQEDILKLAQVARSAAAAQYDRALFSIVDKLDKVLGNPNNDNFVSKTLSKFINEFNIAQGVDAHTARAQVVSSAEAFTDQITSYTSQLKDIKTGLESSISTTVASLNNAAKKLAQINNKLGLAQNNYDLLDERDNLLRELALYANIDFSINSNQTVTVRTRAGNMFVDNSMYSQITYIQDPDLLSHNVNSDVLKLTQYDSKTNKQYISAQMQIEDAITNIGGGLGGMLKARDTVLPQALANINDTVRQIADKVNDLHNRGSGFPPASSFISIRGGMLPTDSAIFKGKVNFAITDDQGKAIKDNNGNYVKPVTVDFDTLYSRNPASPGQFKLQEVINEINQVAAGYSKPSVALGAIDVPAGAPPQWLIDQVRLVPTDIGADGRMMFQLELNSGSSKNVSFQIVDMLVLDALNVQINNPMDLQKEIAVSAGQNVKTGQNIPVVLRAAEAQNIISLKMRVIGENGVFEESWADFIIGDNINPLGGSQIMNHRIEATVAPVSPDGATLAAATPSKFGGPVVVAEFVDSNGLLVTNPAQEGYLKISSTGGGVIVDQSTSAVQETNGAPTDQAQNFGHYYGLNNFFSADRVNPAIDISLTSEILSNNGRIALGQTSSFSEMREVMKGQTLPYAIFNIGVNPGAGATITIGAHTFTFIAPGGVAPGATDIVIGADVQTTLTNISNTISRFASLQGVITTSARDNTSIIITATAQNASIALNSTILGAWNIMNQGGILTPTNRMLSGNASAVLDCSAIGVVDQDTVTVNGITYTFHAVLPVPQQSGDIQLGGNTIASIANLHAALSTEQNKNIAGLFTFTTDLTDPRRLIMTAINAGSEGNNITIDSDMGGLRNNNWNTSGSDAESNLGGIHFQTTNLTGGYSIKDTESVNTYAPVIGVDSNTNMANIGTTFFSFEHEGNIYTQTISNFFVSGFLVDMSRTYKQFETEKEVAEKTASSLATNYDNWSKLSKNNRDELIFNLQEWLTYQLMISRVLKAALEVKKDMINIL